MIDVHDGIVELSTFEQRSLKGGEVITIAFILTYMAVAILTVVVWKLYQSKKGKTVFPGGFTFEWGSILNNRFFR